MKKPITSVAYILGAVSILALGACNLAPDFKMPDIKTPAAFKESQAVQPVEDGSWKLAAPQEEGRDTGAWWTIYNDAALTTLVTQAMSENPDLAASAARVEQARARAGIARADLFPSISANANAVRQQQSGTFFGGVKPDPITTYSAGGGVSYELDVFGRVRNRTGFARFLADAADYDYRAARLILQADVVQNYYALRALAREQAILEETLDLRRESVDLTQRRAEIGEVSELDTSQARAEFATTESELAGVKQRRANIEHGLATLTGLAPADFSISASAIEGVPPVVPAGLPSSLLERRPDIIAAQKDMAAANERIGISRAAFFPLINLTASGGLESDDLGDLFKWSSRTWALGPVAGTLLTVPVFQGGRLKSDLALSNAQFNESVSLYRSATLQAFREVEDQLSNLRHLRERLQSQRDAIDAANRAHDIAQARYDEGYISYLEYIDAQRVKLNAERGEAQVLGDYYIASAQLIRALGGGWETSGQ